MDIYAKVPLFVLFLTFSLHCCNARSKFMPRYPYVEKEFDQYIDHFNLKSNGDETFKQRYFYTGK